MNSTGRNLTIFDKDHNTAEGSRSRIALSSPRLGGSYNQAYGFATITMYSWWCHEVQIDEFIDENGLID